MSFTVLNESGHDLLALQFSDWWRFYCRIMGNVVFHIYLKKKIAELMQNDGFNKNKTNNLLAHSKFVFNILKVMKLFTL